MAAKLELLGSILPDSRYFPGPVVKVQIMRTSVRHPSSSRGLATTAQAPRARPSCRLDCVSFPGSGALAGTCSTQISHSGPNTALSQPTSATHHTTSSPSTRLGHSSQAGHLASTNTIQLPLHSDRFVLGIASPSVLNHRRHVVGRIQEKCQPGNHPGHDENGYDSWSDTSDGETITDL